MKNGDIGGRGRHPNDPTGEIYGDEHWPLPMEHEKPAGALYVILDITEPQATYAVAIGTMEQVQLMGRLLKAAGKNVIAPPCENRGLSCLNLKQLQYLYWNTCKQVPSEVYADLILATSKVVFALPPDQTPIEVLREQVRALTPTSEVTPTTAPKKMVTPTTANPKKPTPKANRPTTPEMSRRQSRRKLPTR